MHQNARNDDFVQRPTPGEIAEEIARRLIYSDVERESAHHFRDGDGLDQLLHQVPTLQQRISEQQRIRPNEAQDYPEALEQATNLVMSQLDTNETASVHRAVRHYLNDLAELHTSHSDTAPADETATSPKQSNLAKRARKTLNVAFIATLVFSNLTIGLQLGGSLIAPPSGLLPETELEETNREVRKVQPQEMSYHPRVVTIRTRTKDWRNFKNILANDVQRHGGWHEYQHSGKTAYYVPQSYLKRIQPLIDASDERPHNTAYESWATETATQLPPNANAVADTRVSVKHTIPVADRESVRITFMGFIAATAAMIATVITSLGVITYANRRYKHTATATATAGQM